MFDTKIPLYGIMIMLSLLANIIVVILLYKKFKFTIDEIVGALVYENIGIIGGAKILTYIQNYKEYGKFEFLELGFSSFGGIIGAIICLVIFGLQFKKPLKEMLFTFIPSIPLMYAIGKIGCFLVGCCYGIEYSGFGSVIYNHSLEAPNGVALFPIQILETIIFSLIFIYMIAKAMKNKFTWYSFGMSFILCGLSKFILDFLRNSHVGIIISLNQILCLIFILIGLVIIYKYKVAKNAIKI
jgi:phosphatidylglycerol:prolipoprotein diacylglycerol transferase